MTIHLPDDLESSVEAVVQSGHFVSKDDLVEVAVREYLRRLREQEHETCGTGVESNSLEVQRRLLAAGIISEIKPPITDFTPYRDRQAVPIQGEPMSETVIRERR
jgi:Arc/MetJ-type ribon-helix-helix transcriptional regulator